MKEPLIGMLLLITLMFIVAFVCRMYAVRSGAIEFSHLEIIKNNAEPAYVAKTTHNLNNLFQLPLLFIVACILSFAVGYSSDSLVFNAWGFVIFRCLHTLVHVTINQVLVRSAVFGVGLYCLIAIWVELLANI